MLSEDEVCRLYDRTGGVPLAIVWSIAQMGFGYGVESILIRLGQPTSDIAQFCFEGALEGIRDKPAHKLLMALSMFATDASREALGYVADLPELDRDEGLVTLEKLSLASKLGRRFELLPLTKGFAIGQIKKSPELEKSLRLALIQYFLGFCKRFGGGQWRLYHNLDEDLKNIQLVIEWAYQLNMWPEVGAFVVNLVEFLDKRGLWSELIEYSEMGVEAGRELNDGRLMMQNMIFGLGWVKAIRIGDFEAGLASIDEGKKLAAKLDDKREYAIALRDEGAIFSYMGKYDKAECRLQNSLEIFRTLKDDRWATRTIGSLGSNELRRGNLDEALNYYSEALERSEETGDLDHIALNLLRQGDILWRSGQFEEARSSVGEALTMYERLKIKYEIARCHHLLAKIEYSIGRDDEARKQAERAYEIFFNLEAQPPLKELSDLLEKLN